MLLNPLLEIVKHLIEARQLHENVPERLPAPEKVRALVLVAAPEGIAALEKAHPDVRCWTAAVDSHLNEVGYIIPGLGDAGDKIFGTK